MNKQLALKNSVQPSQTFGPSLNHIEGIDYLRAIMSVFVVVLHMGGGGHTLICSKTEYHQHVFGVSDFVNFNLLLLAVPTFIFISNFLYASGGVNNTKLKKRLKRILILLTFWTIAYFIYLDGYHGLLMLVPHSFGSFAIIVLHAGGTVYWFFVSLMVCLLMTHLIAKLKCRLQIVGFVLSIIILAILPELTKIFGLFSS